MGKAISSETESTQKRERASKNKEKQKKTHGLARGRVGARRERAARQRARERRIPRRGVRLRLAVVELVAAAAGAPRDVLPADGAGAHERQRVGFRRLGVLAAARRVRRRVPGLAHGPAGIRGEAAHADLRAAAVQAAGDAGAAGAPEGRERQRGVRRRRRHGHGLRLGEAQELVGRGEGRGLAEGELGDRGVEERVGCHGGRGVQELGSQEGALWEVSVFFSGREKRAEKARRRKCDVEFGSESLSKNCFFVPIVAFCFLSFLCLTDSFVVKFEPAARVAKSATKRRRKEGRKGNIVAENCWGVERR